MSAMSFLGVVFMAGLSFGVPLGWWLNAVTVSLPGDGQ